MVLKGLGMMWLVLDFLLNILGFLFSKGMAYFFSNLERALDIWAIQAWFLILGVLVSFLWGFMGSSLEGNKVAME